MKNILKLLIVSLFLATPVAIPNFVLADEHEGSEEASSEMEGDQETMEEDSDEDADKDKKKKKKKKKKRKCVPSGSRINRC